MKKVLVIVIIVVSFLLVMATAAIVYSGMANNGKGASATPAVSDKSPEPLKTIVYKLEDSFITNIKNSNRFLKVNISLELKDEKSKEEFDKNSYKIKDAIISVLRNKTENDLLSQEAQENLKADVKGVLTGKLKLKDLVAVYINEFIIQ